MDMGVCNSTGKTFGDVIQHFIYVGVKQVYRRVIMESAEGVLAIIVRSTSARIRTLVCQSWCAGLDLSLASLVLQYSFWNERRVAALTATSFF
jgi:hypothetical protein